MGIWTDIVLTPGKKTTSPLPLDSLIQLIERCIAHSSFNNDIYATVCAWEKIPMALGPRFLSNGYDLLIAPEEVYHKYHAPIDGKVVIAEVSAQVKKGNGICLRLGMEHEMCIYSFPELAPIVRNEQMEWKGWDDDVFEENTIITYQQIFKKGKKSLYCKLWRQRHYFAVLSSKSFSKEDIEKQDREIFEEFWGELALLDSSRF